MGVCGDLGKLLIMLIVCTSDHKLLRLLEINEWGTYRGAIQFIYHHLFL